jgi:hypothetical protein
MARVIYKGNHPGEEIPELGVKAEQGEEIEVEASVVKALAEFGFEPVKGNVKDKKETGENE